MKWRIKNIGNMVMGFEIRKGLVFIGGVAGEVGLYR